MALTLVEAMQEQRPDKLTGSLIWMFDYYSPVMKEIPQVRIDGRYYDYERVIALPSVAWRAVNSVYTESTGVTNPFREWLKILGGEAKIDTAIIKTSPKGAVDLMKRQIDLKVQAAMNEYDRAFFEGSEQNSAYEMVGLRARCGGNQLILNASGGGALTIANLRQLIDAVPFATKQSEGFRRGEGIRKVLYMNRTLRRKLDALIEAQTGSLRIEVTRDTFGDNVEMFGGAIIRVVEQTGDGSTILGFDEDPGDGASDCASIYCVAFGDELVHGIYNNGPGGELLDVKQFGETEAAPVHMTRFEGLYGLALDHPRCAARLHAITNA